ncbi:MAG: glycosyltransferase family 4 protein [Acidimicrobiales bacterium]
MRIAYLCTDYPAVPHTFIQREIMALEARGHEVVPMTLNRAPESALLTDLDRAHAARTQVVKELSPARATRLALDLLGHPVATLRGIRRALRGTRGDVERVRKHLLQFVEAVVVWRICRGQRVHAIHAHFGQVPATVAWFATAFDRDVHGRRQAGRGGAPMTWSVTIHGWHEFVNQDLAMLAPKVEAADGVVCISHFTRSQLMRIADVTAWDKLSIVRCGLDPSEFAYRDPAPVEAGRRPTAVITARLSSEKGHLVLIQALARLRAAGTELQVRCIGNGPFEQVLRRAAADHGVDDLVEWVGVLPPAQVAAALREADVFCLPSFAEGLPVSIMEAMAVGVPVVTTYISGIPELVVDGRTGWMVPAGDDEALAEALRSALTSPRRAEITAAAREAVVAAHSIATNVVGLERALLAAHAAHAG